jgi:hypothetical protein
MSRHVLDRARTPTANRAQRYLEAERREGLHPATRALIRRGRPEGAARIRAFLRLARTGAAEA